jgi:hypothetical protein
MCGTTHSAITTAATVLDLIAVTYTTHNKQKRGSSIPSMGFEPAIPTIKRLQTCALDSTATGLLYLTYLIKIK